MKKIVYIFLIYFVSLTIISCAKKDDSLTLSSSSSTSDNTSTTENTSPTEDISISSSASDNATFAFGQTYHYQLTTSGTYSDKITYSLSNQPEGMTISSSGLIEWFPTDEDEINETYSNITITITTASGYVLTQTFDLTVTGKCTPGNVLAIWSGDQRNSTDNSKFKGNITAYTDNSSIAKTAIQNYNYDSASVNLTHGPIATVNDGAVFFYNRYNDNDTLYLFYFFGMDVGGSANIVSIDVFISNNESQDENVVDDDPGETDLISQSQSTTTGLYTSSYTGRYKYGSNSDGAVIGPLSNTDNQTLLDNGTTFKIFVDLSGISSLNTSDNRGVSGLTLGDLDSMKYYSKDNSTVSLGSEDNFTVGYKTSIECSSN